MQIISSLLFQIVGEQEWSYAGSKPHGHPPEMAHIHLDSFGLLLSSPCSTVLWQQLQMCGMLACLFQHQDCTVTDQTQHMNKV